MQVALNWSPFSSCAGGPPSRPAGWGLTVPTLQLMRLRELSLSSETQVIVPAVPLGPPPSGWSARASLAQKAACATVGSG